MPSGNVKKRWLRPISELKGGEEPFTNTTESTSPMEVLPQTLPQALPQAPQVSQTLPQAPQVSQTLPQAPQVSQALPQAPQVSQALPQAHANQNAQPQTLEGGNMDLLSIAINTLNTNPYFIGMLMLLLNLGGRFLSMELTEKQEEFLQQRWLRPLIFFTVIFVATRNLAVAFWMTLALFLILWILANEKSPFCIIPSWRMGEDPAQGQHQYEKNMNLIKTIHTVKTN